MLNCLGEFILVSRGAFTVIDCHGASNGSVCSEISSVEELVLDGKLRVHLCEKSFGWKHECEAKEEQSIVIQI